MPDHWSLHRREPPRGAEPGGHVRVVAAGVHDAGLDSARGRLAAQPCEANGRPVCSMTGSASMSARISSTGPGPFFITATTPVLPTCLGHLEAELAHLRRELGRRAHLLHRQLGVGVEVAIERHQLRHVAAGSRPDSGGIGGRRARSCCNRGREQSMFHQRTPPGRRHQLHHVELGFEMRAGHDQPPAIGADPLDIAGDVAVRCRGHIASPRLIARAPGAEEHLRSASPAKISRAGAATPVSLAKLLQPRLPRCMRQLNAG